MTTYDSYIPYAQQHISPEDQDAVHQALSQPLITRGSLVEAFEKEIATYCDVTYAVAFNSATAALMAAYHAAQLGPNDRVITTPNSFIASVGPAIQHGATPIFVDIDRKTGNLNLEQVALNVNQNQSKGKTIVVPVHFSGIPVDVCAIDASISNPKTVIIEDAAHAIGSCYEDGSKVGCCRWSQMTVFSFHPAKTMTTGEGGMVTTNDPDLYHRLRLYRDNGIERNPDYLGQRAAPGYYEVNFISGNYNFTEMQAALGLSQFKRLESFIQRRRELMDIYRKELASVEHLQLFTPSETLSVAYHLCVVQIDFEAYQTTRAAVMEALLQRGIGTQVHYIPLYHHPVFKNKSGDLSAYFPETETYYSQALTIPLYFHLKDEEVKRVVTSLKTVLNKEN